MFYENLSKGLLCDYMQFGVSDETYLLNSIKNNLVLVVENYFVLCNKTQLFDLFYL